jgi:hypothetical protein
MELKTEKIEFISAPVNPSEILLAIKDLWTAETRAKVFHYENKPDLVSFCFQIANTPTYFARVDGVVIGLFWLTNIRDMSAEINFLANPEKYKLNYLKVGKAFIDFFQKKALNNFTFYGFISVFNSDALNFALKIGFRKGMVLKNAARDMERKLCDVAIVHYQVKRG